MSLCVELTVDYMSISAETVWEKLRVSHPTLFPLSKQISLYGKSYPTDCMSGAIRKNGTPDFVIKFDEGKLLYIPVGNSHLNLIVIERCSDGMEDAWVWVKPFAGLVSFRSGRLYDYEYEYWQNAFDPLQYKGSGRSCAGLPMKSNELPPPLERMIIDTGKNPGRRALGAGYVEAVGAVMWLGQKFLVLTGARKEHVVEQRWLKCEELPGSVLRVQAADVPFTSSEGTQGELQNNLRALLFQASR